MGSHLGCSSGSAFRAFSRPLSDHVTPHYEPGVPDQQTYSQTIYTCCSRWNSFVTKLMLFVCSVSLKAAALEQSPGLFILTEAQTLVRSLCYFTYVSVK